MGTLATVGQPGEQWGGVKPCWKSPKPSIHLSPFNLTALGRAGLKNDGDVFSIAVHGDFSFRLMSAQNEVRSRLWLTLLA